MSRDGDGDGGSESMIRRGGGGGVWADFHVVMQNSGVTVTSCPSQVLHPFINFSLFSLSGRAVVCAD